jgi:GNAT superfamily N-acetyltransferase
MHPDAQTELQLVAANRDADLEDIVGGVRYAGAPGGHDCEFAITVIDAWQGQGLARLMLEAIMGAARECGFEHMEGYILASNAAMLGLARKLGFASVPSPEGPAVRLMRCALRPTYRA